MCLKTVILSLLFLFFESSVFAQNLEHKVADKKFWIVNITFVGSSIYDVESTFYVLNKCSTCSEKWPLMKSFVRAGKPATYGIIIGADAAIVGSSYWLKKKKNKFWFILPVALAATHTIAGTHNIRFAMSF
ncbi:MAG: hypothetical protein HYT64_02390 [Candidatus Yanofskybacteria bacterium]|nr:hypothetical protein [Candidatus Yanofskybacteria bacterium]